MKPTPKTGPAARPRPEDRRRVGRAVALWGSLSLGGLLILAALAAWHLVRRGRLLREGGARAREVEWPDLEPPTSDPQARP